MDEKTEEKKALKLLLSDDNYLSLVRRKLHRGSRREDAARGVGEQSSDAAPVPPQGLKDSCERGEAEREARERLEAQIAALNQSLQEVSHKLNGIQAEVKRSRVEQEKLLIESQIQELQAQLDALVQRVSAAPAKEESAVGGEERIHGVPDEASSKVEDAGREFNEVDYAILLAVSCGIVTVRDLSKRLQIKTLIIEEHVEKLISWRYLRFFKYLILTNRGRDAIASYEESEPEEVWQPIREFVFSVVEESKKHNVRMQMLVDRVLLVAVAVLIIFIIYFGFF